MKKLLVLLLAMAMVGVSVFAQGLAPSANLPVADGVIGDAEYALTTAYSDMKFSSSLSADGKTLYFALDAPSSGWVAVGLGSLKMNGAYMVMAYDENGIGAITEETGKGHRHSTNASKKLTAQAVSGTKSTTVLEFAVPAAEYTAGSSLKVLIAYGRRDNFTSLHANFYSFVLPLVK